jgi:hypothetical protein
MKEISMGWIYSVNCVTNNAYSNLGGNLLKRPSRKPSKRCEDDIKLNCKETENENESCI